MPSTPERHVAILRRGSLPLGYSGKWSTYQDIDINSILSSEAGSSKNTKNSQNKEKHPKEQLDDVAGGTKSNSKVEQRQVEIPKATVVLRKQEMCT